MCKAPIRIFNKSKYVNLQDFDVFLDVPCGHCKECEYQKQSEYALRAYNEYLSCINDFGFCYLDTLTYNNKYLPRCMGNPCFRQSDVQKFFKKMRIDLSRKFGYDKDAFRYIVVSEYGHQRKRPHYHVLFFVHVPISVADFHALIHQNWIYGNTDLRNAAVSSAGLVCSNAAVMYVTKYITKEDSYVVDCLEAVSNIIDHRYPNASVELRAKIMKRFRPFHFQSLGFGSSLIDNPLKFENNRLVKCDQMSNMMQGYATMPTKDNPAKQIPLPLYYKRKLFYKLVKNEDGTRSWRRNWRGKIYYQEQEQKVFDAFVDTTTNFINNIDNYIDVIRLDYDDSDRHGFDTELLTYFPRDYFNHFGSSVRSALGDRSIREYCHYVRYYKGRYITSICDADEIAYHRLDEYDLEINPLWSDDEFIRKAERNYFSTHKVDQDTCPEFKDFDRIYNFIDYVRQKLSMYEIKSEEQKREARRALTSIKFT